MKETIIEPPLNDNTIKGLNLGSVVKINGYIYTIRDASLERLQQEYKKKKKFPFTSNKSIIYFCGPSPTQKGKIVGSCGPTTSARMEEYFEMLFKAGVKGIIGKGSLSEKAIALLKKNNIAYFVATGGAGALLSTYIKSKEIIAYKDLGPQAIYKFEVENFPAITASVKGTSIFK